MTFKSEAHLVGAAAKRRALKRKLKRKKATRLVALLVLAVLLGTVGTLLFTLPETESEGQILAGFGPSFKFKLVLFTSPTCLPCKQWEARFKKNETVENYFVTSYTKVTWMERRGYWTSKGSRAKGTRIANDFAKTTGSRIPAFPTFWIVGSKGFKVGVR